jgi:hypothetical protein
LKAGQLHRRIIRWRGQRGQGILVAIVADGRVDYQRTILQFGSAF